MISVSIQKMTGQLVVCIVLTRRCVSGICTAFVLLLFSRTNRSIYLLSAVLHVNLHQLSLSVLVIVMFSLSASTALLM